MRTCDQIEKSFREADSAVEVTDPVESSASDFMYYFD